MHTEIRKKYKQEPDIFFAPAFIHPLHFEILLYICLFPLYESIIAAVKRSKFALLFYFQFLCSSLQFLKHLNIHQESHAIYLYFHLDALLKTNALSLSLKFVLQSALFIKENSQLKHSNYYSFALNIFAVYFK